MTSNLPPTSEADILLVDDNLQNLRQLIEQQKLLTEQNAQLQLLLTTTKAINEASDFQSALEATLCQVCKKIGWDFGEFWIPNADATVLECGKGWYASDQRV